MSTLPPGRDFATDFDHLDPAFAADPYPVYAHLRATCPVAHTDRYGGVWVPIRYADLEAIAHDVEHFSSRTIVITEGLLDTGGFAPPITSDPPEHGPARRLLLPAFAPKRIEEWAPTTRRVANELIDGFADRGACDLAADYAQRIPVTVIALMLGVPVADGLRFTDWIHRLLEEGPRDPEVGRAAIVELIGYLQERVAEHRAEPRDDLITFLLDARLDGEPLSDDHVLGSILLLLLAGIDTTWSAISAALWWLAQHPEEQQRLRDEPALMLTATEEFLRAFSPVTMARAVAQDVEVAGCPLRAGDKVLLPFPAANRDPDVFPDADQVILDRAENRHLAFGVGIHRCLGSNLARMELRVALEEWLSRIGPFELANPDAVTWSVGQVRGPRAVPVTFTPRGARAL